MALAPVRTLGLCALLSLVAVHVSAQVEPEWRPHVLVVDSLDEVKTWMAQPAAQRGADAGRLRDIPTGLRVHLPIVVTNLPSLAGRGLQLDADLEFLGPKGQVLWTRKSCCTAVARDTPQGHSVALDPVPNVQFEPNDTAGTYSVRVVVNDGQRTATTVETFRFGDMKRDPGAKPGPLRLEMDQPKKNPGVDRDVRECLDLPTPAEVIKCTERKK
jgi:hypothetical protein